MSREKITYIQNAIEGIFDVSPLIIQREPKSAFRKAAIASLAYINRINNKILDTTTQKKIAYLLEASVTLNDLFDEGNFNESRYVYTVGKLLYDAGGLITPQTLSDFSTFLETQRLLEITEVSRPSVSDCTPYTAVRSYREKCNLINLACCSSLALPLNNVDRLGLYVSRIDDHNFQLNEDSPSWFKSLYFATMALQVVDDIAGKDGDLQNKRPSYFTAHLAEFGKKTLIENPEIAINKMLCQYKEYCMLAEQADGPFYAPISYAMYLARMYPAFQKFSFNTNITIPFITSSREMKELNLYKGVQT